MGNEDIEPQQRLKEVNDRKANKEKKILRCLYEKRRSPGSRLHSYGLWGLLSIASRKSRSD
jgi:hypothetical protein